MSNPESLNRRLSFYSLLLENKPAARLNALRHLIALFLSFLDEEHFDLMLKNNIIAFFCLF